MSNPAAAAPSKVNLFQFTGWRIISIILAVVFCLGVQMLKGQVDDFVYRLIVFAGIYVTLSVSLNLINGITGQFSIGHAAFYQVGAYVSGWVTLTYFKTSPLDQTLWLPLMMLVGAAAAGVAGLVVGLPSLRLRGDYLAIVTLGFGEIIRIITINMEQVGGSYGLNVAPKIQQPWLVWMLAIITIALCRNLLRNAHGLAFLAVREDEVASSAMGVNTTRIKVWAFVLGSMFAGAAGALMAHYEGFISPDMFKMEVSFIVLTMVVLGGTGSITGSVVAALILFLIPEYIRTLKGPSGNLMTVPAPTVIGILIACGVMVYCCRWVQNNRHGGRLEKALWYGGAVGVAAVAAVIFSLALKIIPALGAQSYDVGQLRMVIFSVVLIIMMLLRPQGLFGHHEVSLRMFLPKSLIGGDK